MSEYESLLPERISQSFKGEPQHWFYGPDCIFCGAFGPIDEDEPCEPIFTLHQLREAINVAQRLAFRERVVGEEELIIKIMRENLERENNAS